MCTGSIWAIRATALTFACHKVKLVTQQEGKTKLDHAEAQDERLAGWPLHLAHELHADPNQLSRALLSFAQESEETRQSSHT